MSKMHKRVCVWPLNSWNYWTPTFEIGCKLFFSWLSKQNNLRVLSLKLEHFENMATCVRILKSSLSCDPIQQKVLRTFEKIEIFVLSNWRFNKLSNDTKLVQIEGIVLKMQVLRSVNFLLFSLYFTHCFAHYLRINLADKMSLLLYWVTIV